MLVAFCLGVIAVFSLLFSVVALKRVRPSAPARFLIFMVPMSMLHFSVQVGLFGLAVGLAEHLPSTPESSGARFVATLYKLTALPFATPVFQAIRSHYNTHDWEFFLICYINSLTASAIILLAFTILKEFPSRLRRLSSRRKV